MTAATSQDVTRAKGHYAKESNVYQPGFFESSPGSHKSAGFSEIGSDRHQFSHLTTLVGSASSPSISAEPGANSVIRMGIIGLSFYQVVGGLIQNILDAQGYSVEITEGSHAEIYPVLGQGDLDMLVAVWLPTGHGPLFAEYGASTME